MWHLLSMKKPREESVLPDSWLVSKNSSGQTCQGEPRSRFLVSNRANVATSRSRIREAAQNSRLPSHSSLAIGIPAPVYFVWEEKTYCIQSAIWKRHQSLKNSAPSSTRLSDFCSFLAECMMSMATAWSTRRRWPRSCKPSTTCWGPAPPSPLILRRWVQSLSSQNRHFFLAILCKTTFFPCLPAWWQKRGSSLRPMNLSRRKRIDFLKVCKEFARFFIPYRLY